MLHDLIALILEKHTVPFVLRIMRNKVEGKGMEYNDPKAIEKYVKHAAILADAADKIEAVDNEFFKSVFGTTSD